MNRYHTGPPTGHFDGTRFFNPGQPSTDRSLAELLRWRLQGTRAPWPTNLLPTRLIRPEPHVDGLAITMIGHASVLIQAAGHNLLLDPVWSQRASPLRFAGPKRANQPGIAFEDLPPIDTVLLTHNHYDHLDMDTLARLHAAHHPRLIAPLGNDVIVKRSIPGCPIETGDWGARFDLAAGIAVTLHPAHHWSARSLGDRRMALWCGFVIQTPLGIIYAAGDTAYGDGAIFRSIPKQFGPVLVAILPIGAYEPRWFMQNQHANPEEAVRIMQDCAASQALGIHWGTFQLPDEHRQAPAEALHAACGHHALDPARFIALEPGMTWHPDLPC